MARPTNYQKNLDKSKDIVKQILHTKVVCETFIKKGKRYIPQTTYKIPESGRYTTVLSTATRFENTKIEYYNCGLIKSISIPTVCNCYKRKFSFQYTLKDKTKAE